MKRLLVFITLFILLLELAWGIAWCIPSAEERRFQAIAEKVTVQSPPAEICAEVDLAFHVRLSLDDIRALKRLCANGYAMDEALRIVVTYRRAVGN